jgi:DNA recombination protein RmuC
VLEIAGIVGIVLLVLVLILQALAVFRKNAPDLSPLEHRLEDIGRTQDRLERSLREEISSNREETRKWTTDFRTETLNSLKGFNDSVVVNMTGMGKDQKENFEGFSNRLGQLVESNEKKLEALRNVVDLRLKELQEGNTKKLDEMRKTVDEKLQGTLEKRLSESFKLVSERLELVHKGLGEMQTLASGVGDLKKVLTNVKARGTWGEIQLGNLLEDVLTPDQYAKNVATKENSQERVEYAVKLPGKHDREDEVVWIPIDSKFPKEDYERLMEAADRADPAAVEEASKALVDRIKASAKEIRDKYINPPSTTDFAILFLPSEGLYAEVVRKPGLVDLLQREFRVNVSGPTTLAALLNSLQMGFRTLAIEKRSSEVWKILGAVRTEFGKFEQVLQNIRKKIDQASKTIGEAETRTRVMARKLDGVQELPNIEARGLLGLAEENPVEEEDVGEGVEEEA